VRNLDAGEEAIENPATIELLRQEARKIKIAVSLTALILTLLTFWIARIC